MLSTETASPNTDDFDLDRSHANDLDVTAAGCVLRRSRSDEVTTSRDWDALSETVSSITCVSSSILSAPGHSAITSVENISDSSDVQMGPRNIFHGNVEVTLMLGDADTPAKTSHTAAVEAVRQAIGAPPLQEGASSSRAHGSKAKETSLLPKGDSTRLRVGILVLVFAFLGVAAAVLGVLMLRDAAPTLEMASEGTTTTAALVPPACPFGQWRCRDGACIEAWWRCSGERKCGDGSDDEEAACSSSGFASTGRGFPALRMKES
ncbi:uncharacterized protein LOC117648519 [Thrips palmi]|uniref:Uncharacterized protein LOC117648519 n=1 Tax=Thrips palmi TaxID=161013 RepID=A0A6P8Z8S9_THRPL|nr:uncharacterized protein LOC117648519 [Thrips palmi]